MMIIANLSIQNKGYYYGYHTSVIVKNDNSKLTITTNNGFRIDYEINSNDSGQPSSSTVSIYNLSDDHINQINQNDYVMVKSGPSSLYGVIGIGNVTNIQNSKDGHDNVTTITFIEGVDYSSVAKLQETQNNTKTVSKSKKINNPNYNKNSKNKSNRSKYKTKKYKIKQIKQKKVNLAFKKGIHAKQIINRITKEAHFNFGYVKLKHNKVYKKGFTVSQKPWQAIKQIVNDCDSRIYYRKNKIIIEDLSNPNPFKEHLYLSVGNGLTQFPKLNSDDNKSDTYVLEAFDDPRISAGSAVYVQSPLDKVTRVQSIKHSKSDGKYQMEAYVYA